MFVVFVAFYSFGLKTSTKNGRLWENSTFFSWLKLKICLNCPMLLAVTRAEASPPTFLSIFRNRCAFDCR